jgi:hypothetical protein
MMSSRSAPAGWSFAPATERETVGVSPGLACQSAVGEGAGTVEGVLPGRYSTGRSLAVSDAPVPIDPQPVGTGARAGQTY